MKTTAGTPISGLFAKSSSGDSRAFFTCISNCSLKDSSYKPTYGASRNISLGSGPLREMQQLWQRIATSARALEGIKDLRAANLPVNLFLMPWNNEIQPLREYRVFCAPRGGAIAAVSQYRWFETWMRLEEGLEAMSKMKTSAATILGGIQNVHQRLMAHPEVCNSGMKDAGFTFDVVKRPDGTVALLELNDFGAMTGCGSCLYQWIRDAKTLYGAGEHDEIEFRVLAAT